MNNFLSTVKVNAVLGSVARHLSFFLDGSFSPKLTFKSLVDTQANEEIPTIVRQVLLKLTGHHTSINVSLNSYLMTY